MAIYKNENGTMVKYAGGSGSEGSSIDVDNSTIKFNDKNQLYAVNNHTHNNKTVLDAFSESGGQLYYNGSAICGSSSSNNYVPKLYQNLGYDGNIYNNGKIINLSISDTGLSGNPRSELYLSDSVARLASPNTSSSACEVRVSNTGTDKGIILSASGYSIHYNGPFLMPYSDGAVSLGYSTNKWDTVYAQTGTINTSDRNEKKDIQYMSDEYAESVIMGLKPCSYKFLENTSDRIHNGMIAQDVEELLKSIGINSKDFAAFIKFEKDETDDKDNPMYGYGLRYEEFIAPLIKLVQYQQHRIENLEERIMTLEN